MAKNNSNKPYSKLLENIESGCWKDKTGQYFVESFESLNDIFEYFEKIENLCLKINNEINNSNKKKEIDRKLKGIR